MPGAVIYRWIYKLCSFNQKGYRIVERKQSSSAKAKALEQRIKELEQLVGQKQIKIDFLEEMIQVSKEELNIDIKKSLLLQCWHDRSFNKPMITIFDDNNLQIPVNLI